MTNDPNAFLMGAGGRSATFPDIGTEYDGYIVSYEMRQQTDFKSGQPLLWNDGNPRMQLVVTIHTNLQEDADDDGMRTLYIKGNMQKAVKDAVAKAGARGIAIDGRLFVRYTGDGEKPDPKLNAPKFYIAKYLAPVQAIPGDPGDGPPPDDDAAPF
jgi:hypothetical protein